VIDSGKYRYRVTIQYNAAGAGWITYVGAYASIQHTSSSQDVQGDTPSSTRTYTVRMRYNTSKTITTRMRISWTTQGATRLLYIQGVGSDDATNYRETVLDCIEEVR
jgi:head-tail adaptor